MENKNLIRKSKRLSQLLRCPNKLGLNVDKNGWVLISELPKEFTPDELTEIVEDGQNLYQMDQGHTKIRATRGRMVVYEVPEELFHGTSKENLDLIYESGFLKPMEKKKHIYMTLDQEYSWRRGATKGTPVSVVLDSARMLTDGYEFLRSTYGRQSFLVENDIPVSYIKRIIWTCM